MGRPVSSCQSHQADNDTDFPDTSSVNIVLKLQKQHHHFNAIFPS